MFQRRGASRIRDMITLGGWLFADLLLALMMIFLISINGGQPPPKACPTPTAGTATASPAISRLLVEADTPVVAFATPTSCPTPTPTPFPCGLDLKSLQTIDPFQVSDSAGLWADLPSAQQSFADQVKQKLIEKQLDKKIAGLAEVYGLNPEPGTGDAFAGHAITALQQTLVAQGFVFSATKTLFQPFWSGSNNTDYIELIIIFYQQSINGSCSSTS